VHKTSSASDNYQVSCGAGGGSKRGFVLCHYVTLDAGAVAQQRRQQDENTHATSSTQAYRAHEQVPECMKIVTEIFQYDIYAGIAAADETT